MAGEKKLVNLRGRRTSSYWEPIYDPNLKDGFEVGEWRFDHEQGPRRQRFFANDLIKDSKPKISIIENVRFFECDFQGVFQTDTQLVFKKCHFELCDLGLSTWINVKFSKCRFKKSSLTQAKFTDCELRDCDWAEVSFSGNATDFEACVITNPKRFIAAGYTNLDERVLSDHKAQKSYQKMRNELTKATTARHLLSNAKQMGSNREYYEAVETFERQQSSSNISNSVYELGRSKNILRIIKHAVALAYFLLEMGLLCLFGFLNGWGGRPLQPLLAIIANWLIFALAFWAYAKWCGDIGSSPLLKSFNIAGLAGYSLEVSPTNSQLLTSIQVVELVIAIVLYTVFFSTVVSRMSRVR